MDYIESSFVVVVVVVDVVWFCSIGELWNHVGKAQCVALKWIHKGDSGWLCACVQEHRNGQNKSEASMCLLAKIGTFKKPDVLNNATAVHIDSTCKMSLNWCSWLISIWHCQQFCMWTNRRKCCCLSKAHVYSLRCSNTTITHKLSTVSTPLCCGHKTRAIHIHKRPQQLKLKLKLKLNFKPIRTKLTVSFSLFCLSILAWNSFSIFFFCYIYLLISINHLLLLRTTFLLTLKMKRRARQIKYNVRCY